MVDSSPYSSRILSGATAPKVLIVDASQHTSRLLGGAPAPKAAHQAVSFAAAEPTATKPQVAPFAPAMAVQSGSEATVLIAACKHTSNKPPLPSRRSGSGLRSETLNSQSRHVTAEGSKWLQKYQTDNQSHYYSCLLYTSDAADD